MAAPTDARLTGGVSSVARGGGEARAALTPHTRRLPRSHGPTIAGFWTGSFWDFAAGAPWRVTRV